MPTVMVSGGFDPIHPGHVRMIRESSLRGDVIVALNSDEWLKRKKGYVFMSFAQRKEVLESIVGVNRVVSFNDEDETAIEAIVRHVPDYFANGGDRTNENTPEEAICRKLGVTMLWNVGGGKVASSSDLVAKCH